MAGLPDSPVLEATALFQSSHSHAHKQTPRKSLPRPVPSSVCLFGSISLIRRAPLLLQIRYNSVLEDRRWGGERKKVKNCIGRRLEKKQNKTTLEIIAEK